MDLDAIQRWATNNKMFINQKKTKSLLVHGKQIPAKLDANTPLQLDIKINGSVIDEVPSHKILGVSIDSHLNFESHIDGLGCFCVLMRIGVFKHISPYLKRRQRETYYNDVIKPTLLYGSMVWDNCSVELLQRILKLQKRAARIILEANKTTPSAALFNNLNWLPFTKQSLIKRCALAYKRVNDNYITPRYIDKLLKRNSKIHGRSTRHSNLNLVYPKYKRKTEGTTSYIRPKYLPLLI